MGGVRLVREVTEVAPCVRSAGKKSKEIGSECRCIEK